MKLPRKKINVLILATCFLVACGGSKDEEAPVLADTVVTTNTTADTSAIKLDGHYFWEADLDPRAGLMMKRLAPIPADSLSATSILERMNEQYPEISVKYKRFSNDTIFLRIPKSSYLTQSMGSSGGMAYLAELTFNLTEVSGINYVDIRFKPGDHALPDTYSRTDFITEVRK